MDGSMIITVLGSSGQIGAYLSEYLFLFSLPFKIRNNKFSLIKGIKIIPRY